MRPIKFLYWNTDKKGETRQDVLRDIFAPPHEPDQPQRQEVPDVLILAECPVDLEPTFLQTYGLAQVPIATKQADGLQQRIYVRQNALLDLTLSEHFAVEEVAEDVVTERENLGYNSYRETILRSYTKVTRLLLLNLSVDDTSYLLACIHFPSKKYQDEISQLQIAHTYKSKLLAAAAEEKNPYADRIIIVGDFNMNPFDAGMLEPHGFHAISNRDFVKHKQKANTVVSSIFYNPCWALLGDYAIQHKERKLGGSHFYEGAYSRKLYWHLFDQVLVSEAITDRFVDNSLQLVEVPALTKELLSDTKRKDAVYSDHLPLSFTLNL